MSDRRIIWRLLSTHYLMQRQTSGIPSTINILLYFNSLPHAEVDLNDKILYYPGDISTHYLTQRQTQWRLDDGRIIKISTHYLTQRQTFILGSLNGWKTFQLTTSRRGRLNCCGHALFSSYISTHYLTQRQTEGFRHQGNLIKISTHYLTQRQTPAAAVNVPILAFQLTTSRRGRLFEPARSVRP